MKAIVENSTKEIKYLFEDEAEIDIQAEKIITSDFIISDLNSTNSSLVDITEDVPEDWVGCKYKYKFESEDEFCLSEEWPV